MSTNRREEIKQENCSCQDERSKQNFINCDMISPGRIIEEKINVNLIERDKI